MIFVLVVGCHPNVPRAFAELQLEKKAENDPPRSRNTLVHGGTEAATRNLQRNRKRAANAFSVYAENNERQKYKQRRPQRKRLNRIMFIRMVVGLSKTRTDPLHAA